MFLLSQHICITKNNNRNIILTKKKIYFCLEVHRFFYFVVICILSYITHMLRSMLTSLWWIPRAATRCRRAEYSTGSRREKRGENCSLPLMTSGNNISEVRRDSYLPLPRRSTWKSRPNSGMSSVRCGLRPRNLYCLTPRAACVYTRRLKHCEGIVVRVYIPRSPPLLYSSLLSLPVTSSHRPPTRISRGTISADSKGQSRQI